MKQKKIKAIIFDLGGVVVHGGYLDFLKHYCLNCFNPLGQRRVKKLEHEVNLGLITESEFYRMLQKLFDVHLTTRQMHNLIINRMKTDKALVKFLPRLKRAKVVLFTNSIGHISTEVLRKRRIPVHKLFDKVFISSTLHMAKPDASAYRFVLKKLKTKPHEALMVDDRLENIRGARKIGMKGLVYQNSRQFRRALKKYDFQ